MNESLITRLVIGETFHAVLGVPVGKQTKIQDPGRTLRWDNGQWVVATSLLDRIKGGNKSPKSASQPKVLNMQAQGGPENSEMRSAQRSIRSSAGLIAAGAAVAALCTALATFALRYIETGGKDVIPIAPTGSPVPAVRSVPEPFARPLESEASLSSEGHAAPSNVPSVAPNGAVTTVNPSDQQRKPEAQPIAPKVTPGAPVVTPAPAPTVPPAQAIAPKALPAPAPAVPPAQAKPETPKPETTPAMLFDAESKAPTPATANPAAQVAPKRDTTPEAPKPKGGGLVAVTPDGKVAIFTDPQTRLPAKFSVGDKLPNGEVVKSIDKSGIVKTEAKEYRLE